MIYEERPNTEQEQLFETDPLKINLDPDVFVDVLDTKIKESRKWFHRERDLYTRRKRNVEYFLGQQISNLDKEKKIKKYKARYNDNIIWEGENTRKPIALSRVPDLLVNPGNEEETSKETAEKVTDILNNRMRKRETRIALGMAYRHRPLYFIGVIKHYWDPEKGKLGDYKHEAINPENIDIDHTALTANADEMQWVAHHYELSVKDCLMRWPSKKDVLFKELGWTTGETRKEKKLATKIKITEVWYTWYEKKGEEWEQIDGVAWKYKKLLLDNIKNPYFDFEGDEVLFTHDPEKRQLKEGELRGSMLSGTPLNISAEKVYYNHFDKPRKPFTFMVYDQLGLMPMDETSRIEQTIYLQDNINKRGSQISDIAERSHGTNVFSLDSGLDKKDVERIDPADPDQSILVGGDLSKVHKHIPGDQPNTSLAVEQQQNRERGFSKLGTNAAVRGIREASDPATRTQLFKESDFTRIDEEVEETVNYAAQEIANWGMQFIKLFYTEEHMVKILGRDGSTTFQKIDRDLIEDGMEVEISASAVDKLRRRQMAAELAGMNLIDPVRFFKDMDMDDPKGRADDLMIFNISPEMYLEQIVRGNTPEETGQALQGQPVEGQVLGGPAPEAIPGGVQSVPPVV